MTKLLQGHDSMIGLPWQDTRDMMALAGQPEEDS